MLTPEQIEGLPELAKNIYGWTRNGLMTGEADVRYLCEVLAMALEGLQDVARRAALAASRAPDAEAESHAVEIEVVAANTLRKIEELVK